MVCAQAENGTYIHDFWNARKLEKSDPEQAAGLYQQSMRGAADAGNADYALSAGQSAVEMIFRRGRIAEAGRIARTTLESADAANPTFMDRLQLRRAVLLGYVSKGMEIEGRPGEAMKVNRALAETLRGERVPVTGDGRPLTVDEVSTLKPELRNFGWRLINEDANLLDRCGRSVEAKAMLDHAAAIILASWPDGLPADGLYQFKVLAARAQITRFLGWHEEAITMQRRLVDQEAGNSGVKGSWLTLQINLLRNRSQWEGPSDEILAQARTIGERLKKSGEDRGTDRLMAKMEYDLKHSRESIEVMRRDIAKGAGLGDTLDALYAERDSLAAQAGLGEKDLDAGFVRLLSEMRATGSKCGEPTIYREYGAYLLDQQRPVEAAGMIAEALRLTHGFGWFLHEPALLRLLFDAKWACGDSTGAAGVVESLEQWLARHPDAPADRRLIAALTVASAQSLLGRSEAARVALARARELGAGLPEFKRRLLSPETEDLILVKPAAPPALGDKKLVAPMVQPMEVSSMAVPGHSARTRFTVFNPNAARLTGHWVVRGPAAQVGNDKMSVTFKAGADEGIVRLQSLLGASEAAELTVEFDPRPDVKTARARVVWEGTGIPAGREGAWDVTWDPSATGCVVLDASALQASPFRYVTLFHQLSIPGGGDGAMPFRLRSPQPLRLEYYDPATRQLLAVDANGNGDFTEIGDLYVRMSSGASGAMVPVPRDGNASTVEVLLFATNGSAVPFAGADGIVIEAEVFLNGAWTKQAENVLR